VQINWGVLCTSFVRIEDLLSCLLPLSILQNVIEFTCSLKQPEYMSCQLNPGCHVPSNQVSGSPCRRYKRNHLLLTSSFALTRLHHWFTVVYPERSRRVQLIVFVPTEIIVSVFLCRSPQDDFAILQHKVV